MKQTYTSLIILLLSGAMISCGKKEPYKSNSVLLKQAIASAADNGNFQSAMKLAFKARNQNPKDANARIMLALAMEQLNDLDHATEEIKVAADLAPDNFMANYTKGRILFKAKIYEDCPAPLSKAKQLKPDDFATILLLAKTYAHLNNYKDAIKNYALLGKMKGYKDKYKIYNEIGILLLKKKDYKRAYSFLTKAIKEKPDSVIINRNMAIFWDKMALLLKKSKNQKARLYALQAVKFYNIYIKLAENNPRNAGDTDKAKERISALKQI